MMMLLPRPMDAELKHFGIAVVIALALGGAITGAIVASGDPCPTTGFKTGSIVHYRLAPDAPLLVAWTSCQIVAARGSDMEIHRFTPSELVEGATP